MATHDGDSLTLPSAEYAHSGVWLEAIQKRRHEAFQIVMFIVNLATASQRCMSRAYKHAGVASAYESLHTKHRELTVELIRIKAGFQLYATHVT